MDRGASITSPDTAGLPFGTRVSAFVSALATWASRDRRARLDAAQSETCARLSHAVKVKGRGGRVIKTRNVNVRGTK